MKLNPIKAQRRIRESGLRPLERLLASMLLTYWSERSPEPWPSLTELQQATGLGRGAVSRALGGLVESGAIRVQKRRPKVKGKVLPLTRPTNHYDLSGLMALTPEVRSLSSTSTGGVLVSEKDTTSTPKEQPLVSEKTSTSTSKEHRLVPEGDCKITIEEIHKETHQERAREEYVALAPDWDPGKEILELTAAAGTHQESLSSFKAYFVDSGETHKPGQWLQKYRLWATRDKNWQDARRKTPRSAARPTRQPSRDGYDVSQFEVSDG